MICFRFRVRLFIRAESPWAGKVSGVTSDVGTGNSMVIVAMTRAENIRGAVSVVS